MKTIATILAIILCSACGGGSASTADPPATVQQSPPPSPPPNPTPNPPPPAPNPPPPPPPAAPPPPPVSSAPAPIAFTYLDLGEMSEGIVVGQPAAITSDVSQSIIHRYVNGWGAGQKGTDGVLTDQSGNVMADIGPGVMYDISPDGTTAVGAQGTSDSYTAILWKSGVVSVIEAPGGTADSVKATGLNDSGEIVGVEYSQWGGSAVMWAGGIRINLSTPLISIAQPFGINCAGTILASGGPANAPDNAVPHLYLLTRTDIQRTCT